MKSAVSQAIRTNRFPEYTDLLRCLYSAAKRGMTELDMWGRSNREHCIMRGWSVSYEGDFHFVQLYDLCISRTSVHGLENMVRAWYRNAQAERIETDAENERKFPWLAATPKAGRTAAEMTLDEFIFSGM